MQAATTKPAKKIPPYFEGLLERIAGGDTDTALAFGRHVHWGYWPDPSRYLATAADYAEAAERLCQMVCDAARITSGHKLLDVGCGFGGTIASLNERFKNLDATGLNIDARQLQRAQEISRPRDTNRLSWVLGDACQLNFPENQFDAALAVECIFHFPDRASFFRGIAKSLKPGARLAISDFVPTEQGLGVLKLFVGSASSVETMYGHVDFSCSVNQYRELANAVGMDLVEIQDINTGIMPTYQFLRQNAQTWKSRDEARAFSRATSGLDMACREGLLLYTILAFQKR